jgi:hypothetical protein
VIGYMQPDMDCSAMPAKRCTGPSYPEPVLLPVSEFGRDRKKKDGLKMWCRPCFAWSMWRAPGAVARS